MKYPFKNLVFAGGGMKGLAYAGAMKLLEERKVINQIERFGGVSAGAIFATLAAMQYTSEEIERIVIETNFENFLDSEKTVLNQIKDVTHLVKNYGLLAGEYFHLWMGDLIEEKFGNRKATFKNLAEYSGMSELYVTCANLSTGFVEVFSAENTPEMVIADAVRASMAIPLLFSSVVFEKDNIMVDGGVINNYPVKLFDRYKYIPADLVDQMAAVTDYYSELNETFIAEHPGASPYVYNRQTLGFHLDNPDTLGVFRDQRQPHQTDIRNIFDFTRALSKALMNNMGNKHLHNDDWRRTVHIKTLGVMVTDFAITQEMKIALMESGYKGAENYFDWFDNVCGAKKDCPDGKICTLPLE